MITTKKDEVKASPFKIANDKTPILSLIEQNNFANQSLHIIGQQLDRIEEKIVEKTISLEKPVSKKSVSVKTEKPLIDLPSQREKFMFKTSHSKTLEIVEKMLVDLKVKTEGTSTSTPAACTFQEMKKKLLLIQNLILYLLFLQKRFLMMIYQKLKDLLETPNPCLLQRIGIQNPFFLICSLKKDIFKHSFLSLLINFMNGILMVCLNKKSLIK